MSSLRDAKSGRQTLPIPDQKLADRSGCLKLHHLRPSRARHWHRMPVRVPAVRCPEAWHVSVQTCSGLPALAAFGGNNQYVDQLLYQSGRPGRCRASVSFWRDSEQQGCTVGAAAGIRSDIVSGRTSYRPVGIGGPVRATLSAEPIVLLRDSAVARPREPDTTCPRCGASSRYVSTRASRRLSSPSFFWRPKGVYRLYLLLGPGWPAQAQLGSFIRTGLRRLQGCFIGISFRS